MEDTNIACKNLIVCLRTSVNERGLLSIIDILPEFHIKLTKDEIGVMGKELKHTNLPIDLVVFWERSGEETEPLEKEFTISFIDPKGSVNISDITGVVKMNSKNTKYYSVVRLEKGLLCAQPGVHIYRVTMSKETGQKVLLEEKFRVRMFDPEGKEVSV